MAESNIQNQSGTLYIQSNVSTYTNIGGTTSITFTPAYRIPKIKRVEFHNKMVTVVYWEDNTVTRVKIGKGDTFNEEYGLAMAVAKKVYGSYDRFAWSLEKAKHYENGKKIKKSKKSR